MSDDGVSVRDAKEATKRVLKSVEELRSIRLSELHCRANKPLDPESEEVTLLVRIGFNAELTDQDMATSSKYMVAAVDDEAADNPTPENTIWTVEAIIAAHWTLSSAVTAEDAQYFAMSQGALACHPYAREIIQSATARMNYPPATMDLLHDPWSMIPEDTKVAIEFE